MRQNQRFLVKYFKDFYFLKTKMDRGLFFVMDV